MSQLLSWRELFFGLAVLLPSYYGAIIFLLYRMELTGLLKGIPNLKQRMAEGKTYPPIKVDEQSSSPKMPFDLIEEFKLVFDAAVDQQLEKEHVLDALHIRARKYSQVKGSAFQDPINDMVQQELLLRMKWNLSKQEVECIWK